MSWWGTQLILAFARSGFGSRCFRLWRVNPEPDSSRTSSSLKSLSSLTTRSDKTSHPFWLLTGNGEYKTHSMLRWLTYVPSSGVNSLFCIMETSCPFLSFSCFQLSPLHTWITFHMKPSPEWFLSLKYFCFLLETSIVVFTALHYLLFMSLIP